MSKRTDMVHNKEMESNAFVVRRLVAFVVDFIIANRLSVLVSSLVYGMLNQGDIQILSSYEGLSHLQIIAVILSIVAVHFFYYVYLPVYKFHGATMMQKVMQMKVTHQDGRKLHLKEMTFRYFVGCVLVEGLFYDLCSVVRSGIAYMISPSAAPMIDRILSVPVLLLSLYSLGLYLFGKGKQRLLHDRLAKTYVIDEFERSGKVF